VELSGRLRERGIFVPAIRPPTVPEGEACLRISLTWAHSEEMLRRLVAALGAVS
jgi:8-amino-7-oxononanoate synthase